MSLSEILRLFWGTVVNRPYVYAFFLCYLVFAIRHLRLAGCIVFTVLAFLIAFGCEYSSTRNGFPFGVYRYYDGMRTHELWLSNVPFWDSLSFVFLSYFSWILAAGMRARIPLRAALADPWTAPLAGLLMMLLDVVIDPLTLEGDRWFLGRVYDYPNGGPYFGVTLANFAGWFFVGAAIPFAYQLIAKLKPLREPGAKTPSRYDLLACYGIYAGVLVFNLAITAWLRYWTLFSASAAVAGATLLGCYFMLRARLRIPC